MVVACGNGGNDSGGDADEASSANGREGGSGFTPEGSSGLDGGSDSGSILDDSAVSGEGGGEGSPAAPDSGGTAAGDGGSSDASDAGPVSCASPFGGGPTPTTTTHLDIGVADPSMIWDGTKYFLFGTGGTLNIRSSPDIDTWSNVGNIFTTLPAWITTALGTDPGDLWAPDIHYFNGQFHVYYAASTFGTNSSVIGLATNTTLETSSSAYAWVDQGLVVQSVTSDDFNAIDPSVSFDETCAPWLSFGSFWTGIKLQQLDPSTGKLMAGGTTYSLAEVPDEGAIEASSIISHNGYFYLFVSFGKCCDGVDSTYSTVVGRSHGSITGPYADSTGLAMLKGGGDTLVATSGRYIGPGGGTAWKDGDTYLYAYHYYDGDNNGDSELEVRPITFTSEDWITLGDPLFP
jgi:arabinan endo-1,5-alpha-L-arabinosidase